MIYLKKETAKAFCIGFILTLVVIIIVMVCLYRQPIQNATVSQLDGIHGIGTVLACEIYDYVKLNPSCQVGDLIVIDGIGHVRLEEIERSFR